jgi:hypothetical protein
MSKSGNDTSYSFTGAAMLFGDSWIGDSGMDHHIVQDCDSFTEYNPISGQFLNGVGGIKTPIHGSGMVLVTM